MYQLFNGDCLEIMPTLPAQSVNAIITDLPYGTTACAWDSVIPFEPMWEAVKQVLKPNGAFVTTASQPFTSLLVCSNLKWFKYEWIWEKSRPSNFASVSYHPLRYHENILVFGNTKVYNPIMELGDLYYTRIQNRRMIGGNNLIRCDTKEQRTERFPKSIIKVSNMRQQDVIHSTQKPVDLYKYLIRTYTNPGDVVLDMCFGSNTTGVACIETGRQYIGIEKDRKYFELGQRRIEQAQPPLFVETGTPANNRLHTTGKGGEQNWLFN